MSGSTHSYLKFGSGPFSKNLFLPNSVLVPAVFLAGASFYQKSVPFHKKCLFLCFYDKTFFFIIKRPDPRLTLHLFPGGSQKAAPSPQRVVSKLTSSATKVTAICKSVTECFAPFHFQCESHC